MTALKPLENRRVRGVSSQRYVLNKYCASPMSEPGTLAVDAHHCFPRSEIGGDSWFVEIDYGIEKETIPHVIGLCREQHERVERHDAWIKLEDGIFNWYERSVDYDDYPGTGGAREIIEWTLIGPLDPQPGYTGASVQKRKRKKGEARRKRRTISIRVPDDTEDGGAIWDETIDRVKAKLITADLYSEEDQIPIYEAVISALQDWLVY